MSELRCEAGYWKSRHADAVERNRKLHEELDQTHADIRQLKADRFGRKSEKQSSTDRSNHLDDPQDPNSANKKKRGQQPDRPGPARRDYTHLPIREQFIDVPPEGCVCGRCGKPLADWGETEDSEQVEVESFVYRRRIRRRRYRKTCDCSGPPTLTAPKPPKLIPKGRYGISLWVHLLLEKFHTGRPIQCMIEQLCLYGLRLAAGTKLREPCRKVLTSLREHWSGLTVFLDDPRLPLDNNFAERLMRNPALGRKNYYGSGAEWAGRLATMMFSILATLKLWKINPRLWLSWYLESCAAERGKAPSEIQPFLPWNLSEARRAALSGHTPLSELADSS